MGVTHAKPAPRSTKNGLAFKKYKARTWHLRQHETCRRQYQISACLCTRHSPTNQQTALKACMANIIPSHNKSTQQ